MEPLLKLEDKKLFYKYLDNANVYFEYGLEEVHIRQVLEKYKNHLFCEATLRGKNYNK